MCNNYNLIYENLCVIIALFRHTKFQFSLSSLFMISRKDNMESSYLLSPDAEVNDIERYLFIFAVKIFFYYFFFTLSLDRDSLLTIVTCDNA